MRSTRPLLVLAVLTLPGVPLRAGAASTTITATATTRTRVGFAVRDITPPGSLTGICLGGYGACFCRQATGVNDRIYARAMVISSDAGGGAPVTVAIASLDLVGTSNRVLKTIVSKVNAQGSLLPDDHVLISATHSHSTPDLVGLWGKVPDAYRSYVTDQTAAAIRDAFTRLAPALLHVWGTGRPELNHSRRGWEGTDPDLAVLDATHAETGVRIGTLISYAAHPVLFGFDNKLISRDWVGYMVDHAEATLGADKVMFINGAQGDVTPRTDDTGGDTERERARNYGRGVAQAALDLLATGRPLRVEDGLKLTRSSFTQCMTHQAFLSAALAGCMDYDTQCAFFECPWTGVLPPRKVSTQVAYLRLGTQVQVAILPGEALTRMVVDGVGAPGFSASSGGIKPAMKAPVRMVFGMTTDFYGYFIPEDEWNSPKAHRNPSNSAREEGASLGGTQANTWLRDRMKALIVEDNATFEPAVASLPGPRERSPFARLAADHRCLAR